MISAGKQIGGLARHSSIYTVSTFVQRALGLIMLPIYTDIRYIPSQSAYGDLSLAYMFIAFMNVVYLYGMDAALLRYFFLGTYKRQDVYKTAFVSVLISSAVLSMLLIAAAPQMGRLIFEEAFYANFVVLSAIILFFDGLGNLPFLILRAEERSLTYSAIRIGRFLVEFALNILFVIVLRMEVLGILYANVLSSFLNFVVLLPFQARYMKGKIQKSIWKDLLGFGLPLLPNGLAYLTVEVSDKYLMRLLLDKETLGIYAPNYKFGSILLFVVLAFRTAWQPFFLKVAIQENAKEIYSRVMTYFVLLGVMIVIVASYFVEYILPMPLALGKPLMGPAYQSGMIIIPVILSAYLFYGVYVNLTVGIYIQKKSQWMIIFTGLAALVNIGSNLYLMPRYGIMGAALATLLSYLTMAVSIYIFNQSIYPVSYEYYRLAFLFALLVIALFIHYVVQPSLIIRIFIVVVIPLLFYVSGFLRPAEVRALKSLISRNL